MLVVEGSVGPIVDVEASAGESPGAEVAVELLDRTDDFGWPETSLPEPILG